MIEGLWVVQYRGWTGEGGGTATFVNGKVLGGDTSYLYIGTYAVRDDVLKAKVKVINFLPSVPNVMGIVGDFDLELEAPINPSNDDVIQGTMSLAGSSGPGMAVKLTKKADL